MHACVHIGEISQNVQMAASGTRTLAANIVTVSGAIEETNRSADQVMDAANHVSGAAESLAAEVQSFFVRLRSGPLDRAESMIRKSAQRFSEKIMHQQ
jgi:methyl-accepting chemotaxis protein